MKRSEKQEAAHHSDGCMEKETKMRSSKRACLLITDQVTLRLSEQRTSRTYDVVDQLLLFFPACERKRFRRWRQGIAKNCKERDEASLTVRLSDFRIQRLNRRIAPMRRRLSCASASSHESHSSLTIISSSSVFGRILSSLVDKPAHRNSTNWFTSSAMSRLQRRICFQI